MARAAVTLDTRLLQAHAAQDRSALVALYTEAAGRAQDHTAERFYLTHAYIFALEAGDARAEDLARRLRALGAL